jgi:hypothetical protein
MGAALHHLPTEHPERRTGEDGDGAERERLQKGERQNQADKRDALAVETPNDLSDGEGSGLRDGDGFRKLGDEAGVAGGG